MKKILLTLVCAMSAMAGFALTIEDMCGTYVAHRSASEYYILDKGSDWRQINDTYLVNAVAGEAENTITFQYFLNYEHYSGDASKWENVTGTVDFAAKTITFDKQRSVRNTKYYFANADGSTPFVATFNDAGVITFNDWTIWDGGSSSPFFKDAVVTLTPNPSVDILCGIHSATIEELDGYDAQGHKDLTKWDAYEWIQDAEVTNAGDGKVAFEDFLWSTYANFLTGTVDWVNMTIEIPVTKVGYYDFVSADGFDFSGDVVKDENGNAVTTDYYYIKDIKPIVATIKPDMSIVISGVAGIDYSSYGAGYGFNVICYFNAVLTPYEEASIDLSKYCGTYSQTAYDGKDAGALVPELEDWVDFDDAGKWDVTVTQVGNHLRFANLLLSPDATYAAYDVCIADVDQENNTIFFPYATSAISSYSIAPYDVESDTIGEGDVIATISEDGVITFPAYSLFYEDEVYAIVLHQVLTPKGEGINDIASDLNYDGPTEYYNLQGMRLNAPAPGQIVIVRKGSKVTKSIIR